MIEFDPQLLFYKVFFYYFQKNYSQTLVLFLLCKQSPFDKFIKFYWKSAFILKTYFLMVLNIVLIFIKI
jgi:hypothetical protein